jgi:hypothetical protein
MNRQPTEAEQCTAMCSGISRPENKGRRCRGWRAYGTDLCVMHGARLPHVRRAAERRKQEAEARKAVVTYGLAIDIGPTEALLQEVHVTAGHVAWLQGAGRQSGDQAPGLGTGPGEDDGPASLDHRTC